MQREIFATKTVLNNITQNPDIVLIPDLANIVFEYLDPVIARIYRIPPLSRLPVSLQELILDYATPDDPFILRLGDLTDEEFNRRQKTDIPALIEFAKTASDSVFIKYYRNHYTLQRNQRSRRTEFAGVLHSFDGQPALVEYGFHLTTLLYQNGLVSELYVETSIGNI